MAIVLTQTFLNNLQHNVLAPFLNNNINGIRLTNSLEIKLDLGVIKLDGNITDCMVGNTSISDDNEIIRLLNNEIVLDLRKLNLNLSAYYEGISDPPILADLGLITLVFNELNFSLDFIPELIEEIFTF